MGKVVLTPVQQKKKSRGICIEPYCSKRAGKRDRVCYMHAKRRQRENNPVKAKFFAFRDNAKRRGKKFELTWEWFVEFNEKTNYVKLTGREKYSITMDRIRNHEGYVPGNIGVLTLSDNSSKANKAEYAKYYKPEDVPF